MNRRRILGLPFALMSAPPRKRFAPSPLTISTRTAGLPADCTIASVSCTDRGRAEDIERP